MDASILFNKEQCKKIDFKDEESLEDLVRDNSGILFGKKTVFIPKSKIKTISLGNSIPDGFLFDLKDPDNPDFYIVEVELYKHDFYKHIFPQITKFIAFFNSSESRKSLTENLFDIIHQNIDINQKFREFLGSREMYKCLAESIENSQNILIVLDKEKAEVKEAKKAYSEWDKLIKVMSISQFKIGKDELLMLSPPFEEVDIADTAEAVLNGREYTEKYHLESANEEIVDIYAQIKEKLQKSDQGLVFNPQTYYISIIKNKNFAYIRLRKSKIQIVVTLPYLVGKKLIKKHKISRLSEAVQKFYHAKCFQITIEDKKNLNEVIYLLKKAAKNS